MSDKFQHCAQWENNLCVHWIHLWLKYCLSQIQLNKNCFVFKWYWVRNLSYTLIAGIIYDISKCFTASLCSLQYFLCHRRSVSVFWELFWMSLLCSSITAVIHCIVIKRNIDFFFFIDCRVLSRKHHELEIICPVQYPTTFHKTNYWTLSGLMRASFLIKFLSMLLVLL